MIERNTYIQFGNCSDASIDYLLGILEDARTTTLQRVADLTPEELHWQFAPGWNTIGALLSHMIADEYAFGIYFIEERELTESEKQKFTPGMEMGKYIPQLITGEPIQNYVQRLQESRKQLLQKIKPLSQEDFYKQRKGYNPKTGYNLAWVLYHLAEDEIHHRGQISILRKLFAVREVS
jgi:uncharacterized damage-inducible protein DinB